jgi:AP-3 complex subunit delta-1
MIGYNIGWAAFAILEVMSQSRFGHKRIGYLAANQVVKQIILIMMITMI